MEKMTKKEVKEQHKQEKLQYQIELDKAQQKKKLMTWGIIGLIVVIGVLGLFKIAGMSSAPSSSGTAAKVAPVSKADITTGPITAKAKIVEYADFQCPGCAAMHPLLKQLLQEEAGKVYFTYRFFPLTNIHKNAMAAAQAALAAYKQGKFWEMHDMLFDTQTSWEGLDNPTDTFAGYAQKLGLNTDQFKKDMTSDDTKKVINDEANVGLTNGVNHTPTLYLNGKEIQPTGYDDLKAQVEAVLATK